MIIKIDMAGTTPIYEQLRNEIVKGIGRGELSDGESLPTVRQLAADLGVNNMTVSKAYQLLKAEGFIETDRREFFLEKMEGDLELLSAEAKIRGVDKEEFVRMCEAAFAEMEG